MVDSKGLEKIKLAAEMRGELEFVERKWVLIREQLHIFHETLSAQNQRLDAQRRTDRIFSEIEFGFRDKDRD